MMNKAIKSPKKKEKHSDILDTVHETAKSLYDSGLMNIATMHTFDVMCLPTVRDLTPREMTKTNRQMAEQEADTWFRERFNG